MVVVVVVVSLCAGDVNAVDGIDGAANYIGQVCCMVVVANNGYWIPLVVKILGVPWIRMLRHGCFRLLGSSGLSLIIPFNYEIWASLFDLSCVILFWLDMALPIGAPRRQDCYCRSRESSAVILPIWRNLAIGFPSHVKTRLPGQPRRLGLEECKTTLRKCQGIGMG